MHNIGLLVDASAGRGGARGRGGGERTGAHDLINEEQLGGDDRGALQDLLLNEVIVEDARQHRVTRLPRVDVQPHRVARLVLLLRTLIFIR